MPPLPGPQEPRTPPTGRPSLQERLRALEGRGAPIREPSPAHEGPPPTDEEATDNILEVFPDAEAIDHIPNEV